MVEHFNAKPSCVRPTREDTPVSAHRSKMVPKAKVLHDAVHPHMEIPEVCFKIINTPTFQRLKNLKQLATCYFVYPSASHNRYEHCIGTGYLAGVYGRILQNKILEKKRRQPNTVPEELLITDKDILCLQIAGLCHDLGHGPYSHTWEKFVNDSESGSPRYKHEKITLKLFDYMINADSEQLKNELKQDGDGLNDSDFEFIKSLMIGDTVREENGSLVQTGRGKEKNFLYEIVANEVSKIDVDKFDYLLRDCKLLNLTTAFDYRRVMMNSEVLLIEEEKEEKRWGIVYEKKVAGNIEDLFRGRYRMHQMAYQHKTNKIVEEMLLDGLKDTDKSTTFKGSKLSSAHTDCDVFIALTDSIFEVILNNLTGNIPTTATDIFKKIVTGDYYQCLGYIPLENEEAIPKELNKLKHLTLLEASSGYGGKNNSNPMNNQYFYDFDIDGKERIYKGNFGIPPSETKLFLIVKEKDKFESVLTAVRNLGCKDKISGFPN